MSGKSVCKKLLVAHCDAIHEAAGTRCRVEYPCAPDTPALVTCCDGMVLLNRVGNVLSQPTPVGEYTDRGFPAHAAEVVLAEDGDVDADDFYGAEYAAPAARKPYGTWRQMYNAIAREVTTMFMRPGARIVVLGFDKKKFVDGVKRITHAKRSTSRASSRDKQIAKDEGLGLTPTRGIPFTHADIQENALIPYPWNEALHGRGQAAALIRFVCARFLRWFKSPREDQVLILDGHELEPADAGGIRHHFEPYATILDRTPVYKIGGECGPAPWFTNAIGEFDHTAFFYARTIATDKLVQERYGLDPDTTPCARVHIRTNDTDTIMMGLVFLERLATIAPQTAGMQLCMEIPRKMPVKTDMCVDLQRMLATLTKKHGDVLRFPGSYFAYGLYLKANDYDMPFMSGVGHATFMSALEHYASAIGDLVGPQQTEVSPSPEPSPVKCRCSNNDSNCLCVYYDPLTSESEEEEGEDHKRKRVDEPNEPSKRARTPLSDPPCSSTSAYAERTIAPLEIDLCNSSSDDERGVVLAPRRTVEATAGTVTFCVDDQAVMRFVAACYYDVVHYRTKEQRAERDKKTRAGTYKGIDRRLLSQEFIVNVCKKRKASAITPRELAAKTRRHNYYVAITEDLMLGYPRSIPFERAVDHGYDRATYGTTFQ